jgi:hypothetical protein
MLFQLKKKHRIRISITYFTAYILGFLRILTCPYKNINSLLSTIFKMINLFQDQTNFLNSKTIHLTDKTLFMVFLEAIQSSKIIIIFFTRFLTLNKLIN